MTEEADCNDGGGRMARNKCSSTPAGSEAGSEAGDSDHRQKGRASLHATLVNLDSEGCQWFNREGNHDDMNSSLARYQSASSGHRSASSEHQAGTDSTRPTGIKLVPWIRHELPSDKSTPLGQSQRRSPLPSDKVSADPQVPSLSSSLPPTTPPPPPQAIDEKDDTVLTLPSNFEGLGFRVYVVNRAE